MFLVASRPDVHFDFERPFFFACPIGWESKTARPKSRERRNKFFPLRWLKSQINFTRKFAPIFGEFLLKIVPPRKNCKFKTFRCLKTKFNGNKTRQGNLFIIDFLKTFLSLKICEGVEIPLILRVLQPYSDYLVNNDPLLSS